MKRLLALLLGLLPAACQFAGPAPHPHYVVGAAYQVGGMWHYPRARLNRRTTGLAGTLGSHRPLTADGEAYDPRALAAASPDLQLPAIARVTNLANGRQLVLRINDRGPRIPGRLLAVTPRVARMLGFPASGVARVRMRVLPGRSQLAADALPGGPRLAVATAPLAAVASAPLGPPGTTALPPRQVALATTPVAARGLIQPVLSGRVQVTAAMPGALWVRLNRFSQYQYAAVLAARVAGLHPSILRRTEAGEEHFVVQLGPFAHVAAADAALRAALAAGVTGPQLFVAPG